MRGPWIASLRERETNGYLIDFIDSVCFIQGDRLEAGAEPAMTARENCRYFFPKIGLSVRLKILFIWIAAPAMNASSTKLHRKIRRTAGRAPSHAARRMECGPAASKMRPKRAAGGEKFGKQQGTFGSLVTH
jgi:hypothetical protein